MELLKHNLYRLAPINDGSGKRVQPKTGCCRYVPFYEIFCSHLALCTFQLIDLPWCNKARKPSDHQSWIMYCMQLGVCSLWFTSQWVHVACWLCWCSVRHCCYPSPIRLKSCNPLVDQRKETTKYLVVKGSNNLAAPSSPCDNPCIPRISLFIPVLRTIFMKSEKYTWSSLFFGDL